MQNTTQNSPDNVPSYPPDNHHSFGVVYGREGGPEVETTGSTGTVHTSAKPRLTNVAIRIRIRIRIATKI